MKIKISYKKELENKEKASNIFEFRISMIASLDFLLAVLCDIFSVFVKQSKLDLGVGALSCVITLYGLNGKWVEAFPNKKLLRKIINMIAIYSVILFLIEKLLIPICDDWVNKFSILIILLMMVVSVIAFAISCIKSKEWKWHIV